MLIYVAKIWTKYVFVCKIFSGFSIKLVKYYLLRYSKIIIVNYNHIYAFHLSVWREGRVSGTVCLFFRENVLGGNMIIGERDLDSIHVGRILLLLDDKDNHLFSTDIAVGNVSIGSGLLASLNVILIPDSLGRS